MSVDYNVALVYRVIEEIWNGRNLGVADALFAPAYVNHGGLISDLVRGPVAIKTSVAYYHTAFPDLHITVEHVIAKKDLTAVHWTARGVSPGHLTGIGGMEDQGTVTGMTLGRITGGKVVESWTSWDAAGALSRLGVAAVDGQAPP